MRDLIAFIPARAGSKRLKNKNLLPVGGVPLVVRAVMIAKGFTDHVVVSTDSESIAQLVAGDGVSIHTRFDSWDYSDEATLDDVLDNFILEEDPVDVLVIQPTQIMYPYPATDIDQMIRKAKVPTALAARAHGIWTRGHVGPRLNTQDLKLNQGPWQELGVRFYPAGSWTGEIQRIHKVTSPLQQVDIDTPADLFAADRLINKLHIVFRFKYGTDIGSGHLNRCLTLANHLQHHNVSINNVSAESVPEELTGGWNINSSHNLNYDVIVNDVLDTTAEEMALLRQYGPVIAVEDQGPGADLASHVVNALYSGGPDQFSGSDWAILRPEFLLSENTPIKDRDIDVLVTFGGTDPNGLTERLHATLTENQVAGNVVYVQPPGSPNHLDGAEVAPSMASLLARSKMVFCSGGRTLYEAAATGTPAFVISQNIRETTHAHLGFEYGNRHLGIHNFLTRKEILDVFKFTTDGTLQQMSDQAYQSIDRKGLDRFLSLIEFTAMEGQ